MTNEELKKKIVEILEEYNFETDDGEGWVLDTEEMADALIAAGIGDTTSLIVENEVLQRDVDNLTRTLEEGTEEFQEVQHRAEVAEKAFLILWNECKEKLGWNIDCTMWYAKQAEEAFAEEKKDD